VEIQGLQPHLYADTQIYSFCRPGDNEQLRQHASMTLVRECGRTGCSSSRQKRKFCGFASVRRQHQIQYDLLTVGLDLVPPVRDLGIYLDSDLLMQTHVTRLCQAVSWFCNRSVATVVQSVVLMQSLIVLLVVSSLDYGSAFQLAVLVYRCQHGIAPPYLANELHRVADVESQQWRRSAATTALVVPNILHFTIGDRSFPAAAARVLELSYTACDITVTDSFSAVSQDDYLVI